MGLFAPPVRVSPSFDRAVLVNTGRVHCPNTRTSPAKLPGRVLSKATWLPHGEDAAPKHSSGSPFRERHCCGDDVRERDSGDIAKPPRRWSLPSDVDGGEGYIRNTGATRRLSETSMRSFPILPHPRLSQSPPTIASADAPSQSLPGFRSPIPEPFPESPGKVCRRAHAARHRSLWSLRRRGGTRMNRLGQKRDSCRPGASAVRPILRGVRAGSEGPGTNGGCVADAALQTIHSSNPCHICAVTRCPVGTLEPAAPWECSGSQKALRRSLTLEPCRHARHRAIQHVSQGTCA